MDMEVTRFDILLVALDPTIGSEIKKSRPAVVISPNEMNQHLNTIIIAPLTSTIKKYPTRVEIHFENKTGEIALDQIRCVDKKRVIKKLGRIDARIEAKLCNVLQRMFAP